MPISLCCKQHRHTPALRPPENSRAAQTHEARTSLSMPDRQYQCAMLRLTSYRATSVRHDSDSGNDTILHFEEPQWFNSTPVEIGVITIVCLKALGPPEISPHDVKAYNAPIS